MSLPITSYDAIADRLVEWTVGEARVRALWIEGEALQGLRRPLRGLRLHLAVDEPDFPQVAAELPATLNRVVGGEVLSRSETRRFAQQFEVRAGAFAFVLIAEQSHLLAKRPRAHVVPLVDKTGHLTHVMDFSARAPSSSPTTHG